MCLVQKGSLPNHLDNLEQISSGTQLKGVTITAEGLLYISHGNGVDMLTEAGEFVR